MAKSYSYIFPSKNLQDSTYQSGNISRICEEEGFSKDMCQRMKTPLLKQNKNGNCL